MARTSLFSPLLKPLASRHIPPPHARIHIPAPATRLFLPHVTLLIPNALSRVVSPDRRALKPQNPPHPPLPPPRRVSQTRHPKRLRLRPRLMPQLFLRVHGVVCNCWDDDVLVWYVSVSLFTHQHFPSPSVVPSAMFIVYCHLACWSRGVVQHGSSSLSQVDRWPSGRSRNIGTIRRCLGMSIRGGGRR